VDGVALQPIHASAETVRVELPEPAVPGEESDLVEQGIAALEGGDEDLAYRLFERATTAEPGNVRAWFWRAKTAETLDEVITCLERARRLEPSSSQITAALEWATQRRQRARSKQAPRPIERPERRPRTVAPASLRPPSPAKRLLSFSLEVARAATAVAAFLVAAVWLLSALPSDLRQTILAASGLSSLSVPRLPVLAPGLTLLGGYNASSMLPYALAFLGVFVGLGLLGGEAWTRVWGALLGLGSAWFWQHAGGSGEMPILLLVASALLSLSPLLNLRIARRDVL
jgi:hypothetical protein